MRALGRLVVASAMLVTVIAPAVAQEPYRIERERRSDLALAAAVGNVVFFPVRLGITTAGGVLGGFTGFMTAGNQDAADDVWDLFQGQNVLTPEIISGKEALRFGYLEFTAAGPPH